ncbi:AAA family ATPase [Christiangramia sp. SM2212]|uniref:AAA family ATPase n=1 Tax=Christiangramia sediminicola TaxID=3073267 RepID=A0ABU1ERW8_9FLAO|nr:AAA family ATPase [Christiangramia sp. SM2212]MDR5591125.1 AAA family ATPase [Christiangramia sp. SM2212]
MSKIRIRNFGPIKKGLLQHEGWIDITKVTIFIGNQGSGKSTVAKLISTFSWMEKALVRGDYNRNWFERKNRLKNTFLKYHRLDTYFEEGALDNSVIEYQGNAFYIVYENGELRIKEIENQNYSLPQILYVPAERNFIAYVKSPNELKLSSDSLKEFLTEFDNAKRSIKGSISIPINNVELEYDKLNEILNIRGNDYKVRLTDASSGFQSLVPVYLVSKYLAESVKDQSDNEESMSIDETKRFKDGVKQIYSNDNLTEEQKRVALSVLSSKFNKTSFINIVEEPEQNLFPTSQWELLKKLIEFNNMSRSNQLIMTTHSPYIINYMSIAVEAHILKLKTNNDSLLQKLNEIVPLKSTIASNDLSIYQLDETNGTITKLGDYQGIPSDNNYLNHSLANGNRLFDSLLEIEQEI